MRVDKTRLLLKHRLGLTMPERDHESVQTMTTQADTRIRLTVRCAAYPPQFTGGGTTATGRFTGMLLMMHLED